VKAFGTSGGGSRFRRLFMSHPPLDKRIETLRTGAVRSGLRIGLPPRSRPAREGGGR
jgi:hypothetical protein